MAGSWASKRAFTICFALYLTGCKKLTATMSAVGMVASVPGVETVLPTGSDSRDIGSVLPAAALGMGAQVLALAWLGERNGVASLDPPTPISDAIVTIRWKAPNGTVGRATLCSQGDEGPGSYFTGTIPGTSCPSPALSYEAHTQYSVELETDTALHLLEVTAPALLSREAIQRQPFVDTIDIDSPYARGAALSLSWGSAPRDLRVSVSVWRIRYLGRAGEEEDLLDPFLWMADPAEPIFDTFPRTSDQLINWVTGDPPSEAVVPGNVLDTPGVYIVNVTASALSTHTSHNLSLGSAALAGSGVAYGFYVE